MAATLLIGVTIASILCNAHTFASYQHSNDGATWQYQAYQDENCQTLIIQNTGSTAQDCQSLTHELNSYRFTSTTNPATNLTFGFRTYNGPECIFLSVIDDGKNGGTCQTLSFESINIFEYEE
ncbi:hypothetical protein QBC38DRAFT_487723 [Podospora fimiseda]|uniref:Uncharacterized protein n=1 Tax=Podospora fimiseda TaxID=252190 RepID=A0AAN7BHK4_9PEZI|nr:hypothetical protein QBC38DRAFT_487723 [Podospora fimiseda]